MAYAALEGQSERYAAHKLKKKERQLTQYAQISVVELSDSVDPSLKRIKGHIPELTRHERGTKEKIHQLSRKPQGRKQKPENVPRPAKYHDWLTPLCWTHIALVTKQVGWKMGASDIANKLKK